MTRRFRVASATLFALPFLSVSAFAQTKPKNLVPAKSLSQTRGIINQLLREGKIMRSSEVKRGMRGVGRSVFQGTKIEEFPVEVLGNLTRSNGGSDIILIRVLGGPVVKRQSGIIAGMSGSPVYINGKMIGAIALGWGFPKEPIGGVTPIEQMIESSLPDTVRPSRNPVRRAESFVPRAPLKLQGREIKRVVVSRDPKRVALSGSTMVLRPATTMLQISGFSAGSLPRFQKMFAPYGIEPVLVPSGNMMGAENLQIGQPGPSPGPLIGPSSRKRGVKTPPFVPGAAVGVQLVSGDMDQTAVGTVTFRWGKRVLGFGHPMFGQGAASLPMTSSYIHEIFPSYQRSFKLASPIQVVGALQQDTQFAIGGTLGTQADTIPMIVRLREPNRKIRRIYRVRVMKDPVLTPQLIGAVAIEAMETTLGLTSDKMVRVGLRMSIENAPPVVRRNLIYSSDVIQSAALADLGQTLAITQANEFARGSIKRVDLDVLVEPGRKMARIKSLTANQNRVKAGQTVQVKAVLESIEKPGQTETHTFPFRVPADAQDGTLRIAAGSAGDYWPLQVRVGGEPPEPTNLRELVTAWNKVGALNDLLVTASTARTFVKVDRATIKNPAPSFNALLGASRTSSIGAYNEIETRRKTTGYMIMGGQALSIPIEGINHSRDASNANPDMGTPPTETPGTTAPAPGSPMPNSTEIQSQSVLLPTRDALNWDAKRAPFLGQIDALKRATRMQGGLITPARPSGSPAATVPPVGTPTPAPTPTTAPLDASRVARPAKSWVQAGAGDFLSGKFERSIVSSEGTIRIAPPNRLLASTSEPFAWSVAGDQAGNVYVGTGNTARVVKISSDGRARDIYRNTNEVAVTSLATDAQGNVYAGVTPGARVYRVSPNGTSTLILDPQQSFAWTMEFDAQGRLLVGTGGNEGRVYRLESPAMMPAVRNINGVAAPTTVSLGAMTIPFVRVKSKHVRAISLRGDEMFLGTGDEGVLYRVNNLGVATALYQATTSDGKPAPEAEITALAAAPEGVYFGSSNSGNIFRFTSERGVETLYSSPQKNVYAMRRAADGTIYAGTGDNGVVYTVTPGKDASSTRAARLLEPTQQQTLALNLSPQGDLLIGTGNNAAAYRVSLGDRATGTFTSTVFDAGNVVQWGAVRLIARNAVLETRSGNTRDPDASWSAFAPVSNTGGELRVSSPQARYLQYRVRLANDPSAATSANLTAPVAPANAPQVSRVEVVYRARNLAPQIALTSPKGGEFLSGTPKLTWTGKDDDSDPLRYRAFLSSDDGATFSPLTLDDTTAQTTNFDTTKLKDGVYRVKLEASDAMRNPDDPRSDEIVSLPFTVDNTAPQVDVKSAKVTSNADGTRVEIAVSDALSPLSGVGIRAGATPAATPVAAPNPAPVAPPTSKNDAKRNGKNAKPAVAKPVEVRPVETKPGEVKPDEEFATASASDGIFDSRRETVVATLPGTVRGPFSVRVQDAAGNVTTVVVPAK